jgi:choline-sulfatase
MMTGWYPHVTGCRTNWSVLHAHQPRLFRYLKEAGYHVEGHGKNDLYTPDYFPLAVSRSTGGQALAPDDGLYDVHQGEAIVPFGEPGYFSFLNKPYPGTPEDFRDLTLVRRAIDFLRSRNNDDPPFMLYLPLSLVHPPYGAPAPYYDMYDPAQVPELRPIGLPDEPDYRPVFRQYHDLEGVDPEIYRKINAVYLGMTTFADWIFGQLMQALEETGLLDNTAVFFFSDHGDYGGDYGLVHKYGSGLEDVMARVPTIARVPGMARGHSVDEPVELMDLMQTTLDLAGIEARHVHWSRSLVPQLEGAPGDPERAVYAEGGHVFDPRREREPYLGRDDWIYYRAFLMTQERPDCNLPAVMMRTLSHKLIYRTHGQSELYDMRADPREVNNLYNDPAHRSLREDMERRILNWLIETADVTPLEADPRGTPLYSEPG